VIDILKELPTEEDQVKAMLPYAHNLAAKLFHKTPPYITLDELYAEAQYGLLQGLRRYNDKTVSVKIQTYLYFRIYGAMQDWLRRVNVSRGWNRTHGQVAQVSSLDYENGDMTYKDIVACQLPMPDKVIETKEQVEMLIAKLPAKHKQIYLLYMNHGYTMLDLANLLGLTESRVSQVLQNITAFLAKPGVTLRGFSTKVKFNNIMKLGAKRKRRIHYGKLCS